jgi:hypothetical protein
MSATKTTQHSIEREKRNVEDGQIIAQLVAACRNYLV